MSDFKETAHIDRNPGRLRPPTFDLPSILLSPTDNELVFSDPAWTRPVHRGSIGSELIPSCGSSIISTHTKTSVRTDDDDASSGFDIQLDDAVYRMGCEGHIKRFSHGSGTFSVQDNSAGSHPPLVWYPVLRQQESAPGREQSLPEGARHPFPLMTTTSTDYVAHFASSLRENDPDFGVETLNNKETGITRAHSFTPGKESLDILRRVGCHQSRPISHEEPGASSSIEVPELKCRRVLKLKLETGTESSRAIIDSHPLTPDSERSGQTISPPSNRDDDDPLENKTPGSPTYIGKSAPAIFPIGTESARKDVEVIPDQTRISILRRLMLDRDSDGCHLQLGGLVPGSSQRDAMARADGQVPKPGKSQPHSSFRASTTYTDGSTAAGIGRWIADFERDYGGLSRIIVIESAHRKEIEAKNRELVEKDEVISQLKAELLRNKRPSQAKTTPCPSRSIDFDSKYTTDAQSFSFPPLRPAHVGGFETALRRQKEERRRRLGDEGDGSSLTTFDSTALDGTAHETTSNDQLAPIGPCVQSGYHGGRDGGMENYAKLLVALENKSAKAHASREEFDERRLLVSRLQSSLNFWIGRSEALEWKEKRRLEAIPREKGDAIAKASMQCHESWQDGWRARRDQSAESMRLIRQDAQSQANNAIPEADGRSEERHRTIVGLTAQLKPQEEKITNMRQRLQIPNGAGSFSVPDRAGSRYQGLRSILATTDEGCGGLHVHGPPGEWRI